MTFTNKYNLAPEVVSLLARENYNPEGADLGLTVTTLCSPIQQTILKRRHPDQLKVFDVSDRMWSFLGTLAHEILAQYGRADAIVEKRFFAEVLGKKVSGQTDHYRDGIITDFKLTKAYKVTKGSCLEWERQTNLYAWLMEQNGWPVTELRIIAFILDWSAANSYQKNYPACPVVELPIPLWSQAERQAFVQDRVGALLTAAEADDHLLPECSRQEMWADVVDYAVIKVEAKRAVKCYATEEEGRQHPFRPGEMLVRRYTPRKRCLRHCAVEPVCRQNLRLLRKEAEQPGHCELIFQAKEQI